MNTGSIRWVGLTGLLLVMFGLVWMPHWTPVREALSGHPVPRIAVGLLPLLFVPLASKLFPETPLSERIPMVRWVGFLTLLFLALLVVEFQETWFPMSDSAANWLFVLLLLITMFGGVVILRVGRTKKSSPEGK